MFAYLITNTIINNPTEPVIIKIGILITPYYTIEKYPVITSPHNIPTIPRIHCFLPANFILDVCFYGCRQRSRLSIVRVLLVIFVKLHKYN